MNSGQACRPYRGPCSPIPGRGCFGDLPGDEIIVSSPFPIVEPLNPTVSSMYCAIPYPRVKCGGAPVVLRRVVVVSAVLCICVTRLFLNTYTTYLGCLTVSHYRSVHLFPSNILSLVVTLKQTKKHRVNLKFHLNTATTVLVDTTQYALSLPS